MDSYSVYFRPSATCHSLACTCDDESRQFWRNKVFWKCLIDYEKLEILHGLEVSGSQRCEVVKLSAMNDSLSVTALEALCLWINTNNTVPGDLSLSSARLSPDRSIVPRFHF